MALTDWLKIFRRQTPDTRYRDVVRKKIEEMKRGGRQEPGTGGGRRQSRDFIETEPSGEPDKGPGLPIANAAWIPVSSSNVEAIRWVGGTWGLEVKFLREHWWYGYAVNYGMFKRMLDAPSKGRFIWQLRRSGVPYKRYYPATIPPRILYPWGSVGTPEGAVYPPSVPSYDENLRRFAK